MFRNLKVLDALGIALASLLGLASRSVLQRRLGPSKTRSQPLTSRLSRTLQ